MLIGCPREIKNQEYRVGLTPETAKELVKHGHEVWIERGADLGWKEAMRQDPHLAEGLNVHAGRVTYPAVAEELGYELLPVEEVLAG